MPYGLHSRGTAHHVSSWVGLLWETLGFPVLDEHFLVSVCLVGSICHVPNITGDGNTDLHLYYHDFVMCPSYGEILL